jgi:hypothetical protein
MNRKESADKQTQIYIDNLRKKNEEGKSIIYEIDEKGRYFSLLFDKNNGRIFTKNREEMFQNLHEKYGKKIRC